MTARRSRFSLLFLLTACNVESTVGYIDGALLGSAACKTDVLSRCDDGLCASTDLFDAPQGSITLAADETNVFFLSNPNGIGRRPIDGSGSFELASSDSLLRRMTSDATHVYWTELDGEVRGVAKAGGSRFDASYVFGNPTDITVDSTHLYWVFPEFGQVAMALKPTGLATHISGEDVPVAITTDSTYVYWVNAGTEPTTGELVRALRGELTSAEVVLAGLDAPVAVAASDDAVYFASSTALFRVLKGETAPQTLATGFSEVKGIGVYGATVYGVGMDGLWSVPARGGEWQRLERRSMSGMAMACSGVYATAWFEDGLVRYAP